MRASLHFTAAVSVIFLVSCASLFAQRSGSIRGTVTDAMGALVPDATVEILLNLSGTKQTPSRNVAHSNSEGQYEISDLAPGTYTVSARWFGMVFKKQNVRVQPSMIVKLNVGLTYEANCSSSSASGISLSENDKAEIINMVLARFLARPGYGDLIDQRGHVVVSTANIKPAWIKPFRDLRFELLDPIDIQQRADGGSDFVYLSIGKWATSDGCAVVPVTDRWAVGKRSGILHMSGGGIYYLFTKKDGKWGSESLGEWVV